MPESFHKRLKRLINEYILLGYKMAAKFPPSERFGMKSQGCRSLLSIMLNYVEGYGRSRKRSMLYFYEMSFGSLKESIYVFYLAWMLKFILQEEYQQLFNLKEEIARMLWSTIVGLRKECDESSEMVDDHQSVT